MQAMVLTGKRRMEMRKSPEPALRDARDVLLHVESVGVCGSDIHYYTEGRIGSQVVQGPFTLGHECSATVLEVGPAVRRLRPGDRVAIDPAVSCGICDQCQSGRRHTCRRLRFLGCPGQMEGCLCERLVMPEECCYPVPLEMSFDLAALVEPLSIGIYAVRLANLRAGQAVGILGAGPIGLCVLIAARERSAEPIYVSEPLASRRAVAETLGAAWVGNPYEEDIYGVIEAKTPLLLDVVFECSGKQEAIDVGVRLLKPGGSLMLIGIPDVERITFDIDTLRRREIRVQNVRRQNECVDAAIELSLRRPAEIGRLHTHTYPFEHTVKAFDLVAAYQDGVVKAMIHMR